MRLVGRVGIIGQRPTLPTQATRTMDMLVLAGTIHTQLCRICGRFNNSSRSNQRCIVPPLVENSFEKTPSRSSTSRPRTATACRRNSHRDTFQFPTIQSSTDHNSLSCTHSLWRHATAADCSINSKNTIGLDLHLTFLSTADEEMCRKKHRASIAAAVTAYC